MGQLAALLRLTSYRNPTWAIDIEDPVVSSPFPSVLSLAEEGAFEATERLAKTVGQHPPQSGSKRGHVVRIAIERQGGQLRETSTKELVLGAAIGHRGGGQGGTELEERLVRGRYDWPRGEGQPPRLAPDVKALPMAKREAPGPRGFRIGIGAVRVFDSLHGRWHEVPED